MNFPLLIVLRATLRTFWCHVNCKLKTLLSVESLKLADGGEAATDQEKTDTLNSK